MPQDDLDENSRCDMPDALRLGPRKKASVSSLITTSEATNNQRDDLLAVLWIR